MYFAFRIMLIDEYQFGAVDDKIGMIGLVGKAVLSEILL
jgi:hypothetical protein